MGRGRKQTAAGPRAGACRLRGVGRRCLAPVGKGCCRYAGSTLFALRAKALQSGAPDHGVSRERAGFSERFAHQGNLPARRGTGERAAPRRGRRYTPSRRQNAPASRQNLPHHPTAANAALYKARLIARRGKPPRRAPKTSVPRLFTPHPRLFTTHPAPLTAFQRLFADILHLLRHPAPAKVSFPPFPLPAHPPDHPAGRTAGSARTRSRGQPLENPFLENDLHCIRLPVPQNAAGGRPLLLGRPPCVRSVAGIETKRSTQAPYSWGLGA